MKTEQQLLPLRWPADPPASSTRPPAPAIRVSVDSESRSLREFDAIDGSSQLGYAEREAAFLYQVARYSGYFLRRQYGEFIHRAPGGLLQSFLVKAQRLQHVQAIDYGQKRHLFHLNSRPVYRIAGVEDSQNRRRKGTNRSSCGS